MNDDRVLDILREAKVLAREYYRLTGKPLVKLQSMKLHGFLASS